MDCVACGQQLPDDAAFCSKCGVPQRAGAASPAAVEGPRWQTCEIKSSFVRLKSVWTGERLYTFYAEAAGPAGRRRFGDTPPFGARTIGGRAPGHGTEPAEGAGAEALGQLVRRLVGEGWEPLPRGAYWFSHRFRRRVP